MGKTSSRSEPSTRADRKFEKKLQFYAKVRDTVASLGVQKAISKNKKDRSRKKKLEAYDFSSLSEFLPDLKVSKQVAPTKFKLNSKSRQTLILREANQLQAVLNHPAFLSDPLAAIHQHLHSTQPGTDQKPERKHIKSGKKQQQQKKNSKTSKSMEI
ncbi:ribosome biogenesis protein slx9-like isoform X1 [Diospyros lotus]|uniref:ribosome biogenesis protein slx9-like isoform X1 n=1 Tax=Diospyros lotus TaxID=55363 RepID=UPI00224D17AE|nr:ribosome biogenesis protein slx9-like isoform X1 [Diospyros lotus]